MKHNIIRLFLSVIIVILAINSASARSAILMAHYGSSNDDTRAVTIDRITSDVQAEFPDILVVQSYISPVVRKNLAARGIPAPSPAEMLQSLADAGVDTVYVQSSTIIEGVETADVRKVVDDATEKFKHIVVGNPLCFSPDDCRDLVKILGSISHDEDEAVVWCGHGNNLPSTATYAMLDHMLHANGIADVHVSTIEGYPTAQSTVTELKQNDRIKRVRLIPLLLVCGNHTKNDIADEFAAAMQDAGYDTSIEMIGLAQRDAVRALYVQRVKTLIEH